MWSEHVNELLACRGCLVTNVKLYSLHENRLVEPYEELVGIPVLSSDHYPQHVCSYCHAELRKFLSFRNKCRKSQEVLRDFELTGKSITTQNISTIDRHYYQLAPNFVQTKIDIVDVIDNDQKIASIVKQEDCSDDYADDDNALYLTDHKIEIGIEVDENVNKEEKDSDPVLEKPIEIFVEDQKPFKREKVVKKAVAKKTNTKKPRRKIEIYDSDTDSDSSLDIDKFISENVGISDMDDSDSDIREIAKIIGKPECKRKKVVKKKAEKKVGGKKEASNDEIRELANSLDFDVHFLTKEEQHREVEERKNSDLDDRLIMKCESCGKNFRDHNTVAKHQKDYHDPAAGRFICELCSCRFKSNHRLRNHLRIHRVKFRCRNCEFSTKIRANLIKHYDWHQGKRQTCPYCERVFEKISSYFSHVRLKHAAELTWCDLCGESFIGEKGVKAHQRRAHKNVKKSEFKCTKCNTNFINEEAFTKHEKADRCDLSSCTKCGESFVSEKILKYHLVQHHNDNIFEVILDCDGCQVKFQNAGALKKHRGICIQGGIPCVQCGSSFTTNELLNEHMIEKHTLENTFTCEECNKTFSNAFYFRDHYSRVHWSRMPRRVRDNNGKEKPARPPVKVRRRANRGEFDTSIRKWRVVGEEAADVVMEKTGLTTPTEDSKPVMCEVCGKSFINSGLLKYHQRIHTGEKPFECPHCSKSFNVKSVLMQHIRVHTGERPYACKHCPKAFKSPSALYRHDLVHSGIRRHVCQLCDKSFQTSSCVKLHIKTVHMKLPMPPRNRRRNRVKDE